MHYRLRLGVRREDGGLKDRNMDFYSDLCRKHLKIQFPDPAVDRYVAVAHWAVITQVIEQSQKPNPHLCPVCVTNNITVTFSKFLRESTLGIFDARCSLVCNSSVKSRCVIVVTNAAQFQLLWAPYQIRQSTFCANLHSKMNQFNARLPNYSTVYAYEAHCTNASLKLTRHIPLTCNICVSSTHRL